MLRNVMSRVVVALLAVAIGCGVMASTVEAGKDDKGGGGNKAGRVEGTLTALGASSVTITPRNGNAVTVQVTGSTKIERNGRHVPFTALKVGDRAEARFDPATGVATKVESVGP